MDNEIKCWILINAGTMHGPYTTAREAFEDAERRGSIRIEIKAVLPRMRDFPEFIRATIIE